MDSENIETAIYSYNIISGDMHHSAVAKREIFLIEEDSDSLVFRGVIPGSENNYFADLSQILLEYAMSCDGCVDQALMEKEVDRFGVQIGRILAKQLMQAHPHEKAIQYNQLVIRSVLKSLGAQYTIDENESKLTYLLACCPISECGKHTGLGNNVNGAYIALISLIEAALKYFDSNWKLIEPSVDSKTPLRIIVLAERGE